MYIAFYFASNDHITGVNIRLYNRVFADRNITSTLDVAVHLALNAKARFGHDFAFTDRTASDQGVGCFGIDTFHSGASNHLRSSFRFEMR
ncbi:hypothetical protein D3C71_1916150 [compost metagenome]